MRNVKRIAIMTALPAVLAAAVTQAGNGVQLNITNDSTDDIVVTVYDRNAGPDAVVLSHTRINGFTTVPVSVSPDDTGRADVAWTAISANGSSKKCGHSEDRGVRDSSSVNVSVQGECGG